MTETERMLMLLDGLREQVAAGVFFAYVFAWHSPPAPVEAAAGRMAEAAHVPFTAPPPAGTVHLLLTFGPDGQKVIAAHAHVSAAMTAGVESAPT